MLPPEGLSGRAEAHIFGRMSVLVRAARQGFIEPCLPYRTAYPPLGPGWIHEIKYDAYGALRGSERATSHAA